VTYPGSLDWQPSFADLVAAPVAAALDGWARTDEVRAAPIDADLADTAQFCEHYGVELADSANCVVIAGKRGDTVTYAACVVLATTRADVNGTVRRRLNAKKASFAAMDDAVERSAMEYGGITPIGVPADWPVLIDRAVLDRGIVVIGSGLRRSKLALPSDALAELPNAEVIDAMAG
jgi:prolyl-tRNA editing enzyme YbaK/EbsC (Cys-tRNA(Pro) deacylase)